MSTLQTNSCGGQSCNQTFVESCDRDLSFHKAALDHLAYSLKWTNKGGMSQLGFLLVVGYNLIGIMPAQESQKWGRVASALMKCFPQELLEYEPVQSYVAAGN